MLKEKKTKGLFSLNYKQYTKKMFSLSSPQVKKIDEFIDELIEYNKHTNLVGKSTLINPWRSHILDSIQITDAIKNKKSSILDMGTGAGLPGLVLAIMGYEKITLVDSNGKKINFIKQVCKKLNIKAEILLKRIEKIQKKQYDFLISRALSRLNNLFVYSHKFINNRTTLVFLKGKNATDEIYEARAKWSFNNKMFQSKSDERGKILVIKNLSLKSL